MAKEISRPVFLRPGAPIQNGRWQVTAAGSMIVLRDGANQTALESKLCRDPLWLSAYLGRLSALDWVSDRDIGQFVRLLYHRGDLGDGRANPR